jgi:hypothetical protein
MGVICLVLSLLLSACGSRQPEATQASADAVYTAAAQTAGARMTEIAALTPTPPPATATFTLAPPTASPTVVSATATQASPTVASGVSQGTDGMQYVSDVTVPDGTTFQPGEIFVKTWSVQNTGTSTWNTGYKLAFVSGTAMTANTSVAIPQEVGPGQTANLSVNLTAPADSGTYTGNWQMTNAQGMPFGAVIYLKIAVSGASATPGPSPTPTTGPSPTAGPSPTGQATSPSGSGVSDVTIAVDDDSVETTCPYSFQFTGQFTLAQDSAVTFELEAGSDTAGFQIDLPGPTTTTLKAGQQTVSYELEFPQTMSGWVRLHVTQPADMTSEQVNISLTCQ